MEKELSGRRRRRFLDVLKQHVLLFGLTEEDGDDKLMETNEPMC